MKTHTLSSAHLMSKSCNKELNPQFMSWGFSNNKMKLSQRAHYALRRSHISPSFPRPLPLLICSMILNICLGQNFTGRLRFCVGKANILVNSIPCS